MSREGGSALIRGSLRSVCYLLGAFLSLCAVSLLLIQLLFRLDVKPLLESARQAQEHYYKSYLSDLDFLAHSDLPPIESKNGPNKTADKPADSFADPTSLGAKHILNHRVYWAPLPQPIAGYPSQPRVNAALRETLFRFRTDWMKKYERMKHLKVDFSLFADLAGFAFWDLETDSPIAELSASGAFVPPATLPAPDVSDLLALVKLRLMAGAADEQFLPALGDVRRLATLMMTTENTQLVVGGLAALDYERFAYRFYVEERGLKDGTWQPIDRNSTRRAHRAILATRAYFHLWTEANLLKQIFLGPTSPIGFCAAANESLPIELTLRPKLEPTWPLEFSLKPEYILFDSILNKAQSACRLKYIAAMEKKLAFQARVPGPLLMTSLPYSRKIFGLRSSVLNSQGFESYEALNHNVD